MSKEEIARRNDELRRNLPFTKHPKDKIMMTRGFLNLDADERMDVLEKIRDYTQFNEDTDPYGEHDCGLIVRNNAENVMFKVDYYDDNYEYYQKDGNRVLTIMLASEY